MARVTRSAFDRSASVGALLAFEPLFLLVVAGAVVGIAIQAVIVAGMICAMVHEIRPHEPSSWLHRKLHGSVVWFGGRTGSHAHAVG